MLSWCNGGIQISSRRVMKSSDIQLMLGSGRNSMRSTIWNLERTREIFASWLKYGEVAVEDALGVKLFPLSLSRTAFTWFASLPPNSIYYWAILRNSYTNTSLLKFMRCASKIWSRSVRGMMNRFRRKFSDSVTSGANASVSTCQIASLQLWLSSDFCPLLRRNTLHRSSSCYISLHVI